MPEKSVVAILEQLLPVGNDAFAISAADHRWVVTWASREEAKTSGD
jgi:hypothetical protein